MKKRILSVLAIIAVCNSGLFCYEYKSSSNYRAGHAAWLCGDGNNGTYWQLDEKETAGYISVTGEAVEKKKVIIEGEIASESRIQLYADGGKGKRAVSGCVKYGPAEGTIEFDLPENMRACREIQIHVSGENACETKISEVRIENETGRKDWGKIKPYKYSINIEENINLRAERLWDGMVEDAWFESNWYVPWDISSKGKENRAEQIFGKTTGYPSKNAEIIWELDGEYEISAVKAYIVCSWRSLRIEYEDGGKWKNLADLGPDWHSESWLRKDVNGIRTSRIRITFPDGWEMARYISEIEIWGSRTGGEEKEGSGSLQLHGTRDAETGKNWYIFETERKKLEVEVTYKGERETIPVAEINNRELSIKSRTQINGNDVIVYSIEREELRNGQQFLCIKDENAESVLLNDYKDDGTVNPEENADIEKIFLTDENGTTVTIDGNGEKLSSIDLSRYENWTKKYYGSVCRDKEVSVELYRPQAEDEEWNGSIVGMTGDPQTNVTVSGYGVSRADRVFWQPVNYIDFYKLKGKIKISAENDGRKTEYEYLVKGGKKQKGGYIKQTESLEYTVSDKWTVEGKVYDKGSIVYVNGKEVEKNPDGTFTADVELKEGYQCITIENISSGNTVGYWTKEIYRHKDEGIVITLNGDENGVITRESEYKIAGDISNCTDVKLTVNGRKAAVENGRFEYTVKLTEGENQVVIKAEDGSKRTKEIEFVIIRDTTPPEVEIEYPAEGDYISSSEITLTVKADGKDYWYSLNGESPEYCDSEIYRKEIRLADDFYGWNITVADGAGNKTEEIKFNFCIDITSPEAFTIIPDRESTGEKWRDDGKLTVEFNTADATSGIERYEYTWGESEWEECSSPLSFSDIEDGKHTLFIRAVDRAGNTTLSALDVYTDITAPAGIEVTADIEEKKWTNHVPFGLYISSEDETSGIREYTVTVDDGEEKIWNSGDLLDLKEDGVHLITVRAYDRAGNSVSAEAEYYTDKTVPEPFEAAFNVAGWTNNNKPEAVFMTTDGCSGIDRFEMCTDEGEWETVESPYTYPALTDGIHTVRIRAYDKAGNYTETGVYELKIDTVLPKAVFNYRLISGNGNMEGVWETEDEDIIAYHLLWNENGTVQNITTSETCYKKNVDNGTTVKVTIQAEDRAHNFGPAVETALSLTGAAIVPLKEEEATLVEYNNIKMAVPPMGPDSKILGVMIKEIESPVLAERSVNPILSPIYSFTTLEDNNGNGVLTETNHASFEDEVLVFLSYDDSIVPEGFPESNLEVYYYDDLWGRWFRAEKASIDIEQNIIIFATNHFTNFSIQPTLLEDLSPEELKKAGHAYGNTESVTGDIAVSAESGTMLTEATEFIIHGKNGFEFPVKRMYDTQTARLDGPSIQTQLTLGLNFGSGFVTSILEQLKVNKKEGEFGAVGQLAESALRSSLKNYFARNGDYNLAMGAGWRLSLPYIMVDNNNVMVRLPNGAYYSTNQMEMDPVNNNIPALYHDMVLENHIGDDFTLSVKMRKAILPDLTSSYFNQSLSGVAGAELKVFNEILSLEKLISNAKYSAKTVSNIIGTVSEFIDWVIEECILTMKDGMQYKFGPLGYITEITDPSGTNVIKFEYKGLQLDKIIDPNGNEIKFEYNETSFLRPYITKINAPDYNGGTRTWTYTYDSQILNLVANSMFCILPQLKTATDPEQRRTEYEVDYSENNVLLSGGGSAKLNVASTILDICGLSAVKDILGIYSLTLTARFGIEWPQFIKSIKAHDKGIQTVNYRILDTSLFEVKPADYFIGLIPTAVKISADFCQKLIADSVTIKNGSLSRTTSYDFTFRGYGSQHLVTRSVINDGRQKTINDYDVKNRSYYKYTCIDDNITDLLSCPALLSEESNFEKSYYTQLKTRTVLKKDGSVYEKTDYTWDDDHNRLKTETTTRGPLSEKKEYDYDDWGNIVREKETGTSETGRTQKITESKYYDTESQGISNFPAGIPSTKAQSVRGLKNLLVAQSVNDGYTKVYTGNAYDEYGRNVWSGIYTDDGKWAGTVTEYRSVTGRNPLTDGLTAKTVSPAGLETEYSYKKSGEKLITELKKKISDSEDSFIIEKKETDINTGLPVSEEDGNGNRTVYEYDSLGRQTKITYPGDISDSIEYDDRNHIIKVFKDGSIRPAEKFVYDDLHNLISDTKYSYTGDASSITVELEYDCYNNTVSLTDQNRNRTNYEYDGLGRMIKQLNPDNTYIKVEYDDSKALKKTTDENDHTVEEYLNYSGLTEKKITSDKGKQITEKTFYDGNGRPVKTEDGLGQITEISYSVFGKEKLRKMPEFRGVVGTSVKPVIKTEYDESGLEKCVKKGTESDYLLTETEYDKLGRKIKVSETYGSETRMVTYEYDNAGNVIKETDGEGNTKTSSYTERNKPASETDALGYTTLYEYDRDDNVKKMTDAAGNTVLYTYDGYKRLLKAELPSVPGNEGCSIAEITYDARGNALTFRNYDGKLTLWTYDSRNRKLTETLSGTGAVSVTGSWTYDGVGNILTERQGNAETENEYDDLNRIVRKNLPDGQTETYEYDEISRVIKTEGSSGTTRFVYNSLNKVTKTTDALNNVTEQFYDVFGNAVKTVYENSKNGSGDQIWERKFNAWNQVLEEKNNFNQKWTYSYDGRGLLTERTDPAGTVTEITYDGNGNVVQEKRTGSAKPEIKTYSYDKVGFMYKASDNGVVSKINYRDGVYEPNAWGLITSFETTAAGKTIKTEYAYDRYQNNVSITYPDTKKIKWSYNGLGQVTSIGDEQNNTGIASGGTYSSSGRPVSINAGNGTRREYSWDSSKNLLTGYEWGLAAKQKISLEWDNKGNITAEKGKNTRSYVYDTLNRLISETTDVLTERKGSSSFTAGYAGDDVSGSLNLDYRKKSGKLDYYASSMGYSLNGTKKINSVQVTGKSDRLDEKYMEIYVSKTGNDWTKIDSANLGFMKTSDGLKVIFRESIEASYIKIHSTWDERDEDYKPVDKSEVYGNIADIVEVYYLAEGKENHYTYDAKGNRITYRAYTGTVPEETLIEYYQYSDLLKRYGDWYFSYDANGNLTARGNSAEWNPAAKSYEYSETDGELWAYEYDLSNRLTKVLHSENGRRNLTERASYTYDYRGLCVVKNSEDGTEYREYSADGKLIYTEKGEDRTDYIYKSNTVFAEIRQEREGEAVYYHHTDHLGTTRAVSDENGAVVWEAETEAFGSVLSENGTKVFTASYTGKLYDEDAGMYYFNARWYDAEIGRFVTEDPARDGANWYAYCGNNPLTRLDLDGLFERKFNSDNVDLGYGIVEKGDTFNDIYNSLAHEGVTREEFAKANGIKNMDHIVVGQEIKYDFNSPESDLNMIRKNVGNMENHTLDLLYFNNMVKTGGPWDFKNVRNSEHRNYYWFGDDFVTAEEFGNLHYGIVGAAAGIPTDLLLDAPGPSQVKSLRNNPINTSLAWISTNFDDPRDTKNILKGINSYRGSFQNQLLRGAANFLYNKSFVKPLFRAITLGMYVDIKSEMFINESIKNGYGADNVHVPTCH